MIVGGESMNRIYISSRNQNQFFEKREMLLGQKPDEKFLWFLGLGDHQTKEKPWRIYLLFMKCWFISLLFAPKKPGFPLEVANGEMEKSLGPILENSLCLGCLLFVKKKQIQWYPTCFLLWIEEATEVMEDPNGRWFSFVRRGDSFVILEKKGLPTHLQSLECVDVAIKLQALVSDFEDQGEACVVHFFGLDDWVFFSNVYYKILSP